jgi:Patatin-like phospholipase
MPEQPQPTFEIGLVMAGAISGGAYAAGVIDFLIQALDCWEEAKVQGTDVPRHRVMIPVMSGASAGAMVAAIAAVSFGSETRPFADPAAPPAPELNRLYDAWVRQIDIHLLLGQHDLDGADKVTALLDSTSLQAIAEGALRMRTRPVPRAYVADPLAIFLTISNLRGVPYGFRLFGSRPDTLYGMSSHADRMAFALSPSGRALPDALPLAPADAPAGNWRRMALAALASGAFPIGLQARLLERPHADYRRRFDRPPEFGDDADPYRFLTIDGG